MAFVKKRKKTGRFPDKGAWSFSNLQSEYLYITVAFPLKYQVPPILREEH